MSIRRQPARAGIGKPRAKNDQISERSDAKRKEYGGHTTRIPVLEKVSRVAQETEPGSLQYDTEDRPQSERSREANILWTEALNRSDDCRADGQSERDGGCLSERQIESGCRRPNTAAGTQINTDRHLPSQTVPARLATGTPTELPYSVQEPS